MSGQGSDRLVCDFCSGSKAVLTATKGDFRYAPNNGHHKTGPACLKGAANGYGGQQSPAKSCGEDKASSFRDARRLALTPERFAAIYRA
jgi:hypothetical protein